MVIVSDGIIQSMNYEICGVFDSNFYRIHSRKQIPQILLSNINQEYCTSLKICTSHCVFTPLTTHDTLGLGLLKNSVMVPYEPCEKHFPIGGCFL